MPSYVVEWMIDIDDADSPRQAAEKAFAIVQRPGTSANVFDVTGEDSETHRIDLQEIWQQEAAARIGLTALQREILDTWPVEEIPFTGPEEFAAAVKVLKERGLIR